MFNTDSCDDDDSATVMGAVCCWLRYLERASCFVFCRTSLAFYYFLVACAWFLVGVERFVWHQI